MENGAPPLSTSSSSIPKRKKSKKNKSKNEGDDNNGNHEPNSQNDEHEPAVDSHHDSHSTVPATTTPICKADSKTTTTGTSAGHKLKTSSSDQHLNLALAPDAVLTARKLMTVNNSGKLPATIKEEGSSPPNCGPDDNCLLDRVIEDVNDSLVLTRPRTLPLIRRGGSMDVENNDDQEGQEEPNSSPGSPPACFGPTRSSPNLSSHQIFQKQNDSNNPALPIAMSDKEIAAVRSSLEALKPDARDIGSNAIRKIIEEAPETVTIWGLSCAPKDRATDSWRIMGQGMTLLSGFEKIIMRIDRPARFRSYIKQMLSAHRERYNVNVERMAMAIGIFQAVLLDYWKEKHQHSADAADGSVRFTVSSDEDKDGEQGSGTSTPRSGQTENCAVCAGWTKLFENLLLVVHQQKLESQFLRKG